MFRVIDFMSLLKYAAIFTTFVSILAYEVLRTYWNEDLPLFKIISIAPWVSLSIVFFVRTSFSARFIWKCVRKFNRDLYPDLNGVWEGEITTESGDEIAVRAAIKHTLLETHVDIHTATSKSLTLEATPLKECGQPKLYYTYRSFPKRPGWQPYTGITIFDVRNVDGTDPLMLELSGPYFTDRQSVGRVRLRQVSKNVDKEVSFY